MTNRFKLSSISFSAGVVTMALCVTLSVVGFVEGGVGEAAVITLAFPPGARATGIGEAFTGLSDDATATYYNPAGLGLSPLANSWKAHLIDQKHVFTALAAKKKRDFGSKGVIWAGTARGLLRYNGKLWEKHEFHLIEQTDNLLNIANRFIEGEDKELLRQATWIIRSENGIGMKRYNAIRVLLEHEFRQRDTVSADSMAQSFARQLIELPSDTISSTSIYGLVAPALDSGRASTLSDQIAKILSEDDRDFDDLTELRIPFSIAISDSITAMGLDKTDKLWVGTTKGLWRYSEKKWVRYTMLDGLPSNVITCLSPGPYGELAIGTDNGVALFKDGEWSIKTDSTSNLPSNNIKAVQFGFNGVVYAGTEHGLIKIDKKITVYDTADGLLSQDVRALFFDSDERLWIGGPEGATVFNNTSWKRYQFPGSVVSSFAEQNNKSIWMGTDKGAISYTPGKSRTDEKGNVREAPAEWKAFHSKNALVGDHVNALIVHDKDVWLATERGINQYDNAERQVSIAFEMLLPAFKLSELWHLYGTMIWPTQDWGTIGFLINYINMGRNTMVDALGRVDKEVRSWEGVFGLSYGITVREDFSLGLNAKYVVSALAPGIGDNGEGVGQTFAIDAALLKRNFLHDRLDLGFMFQNMGPNIYYIDRNSRDPIPFTLRMGLALSIVETPINDLKFLFDIHKEVVKNRWDGEPDPFYKALWTDLLYDKDEKFNYEMQEINYNFGFEYWYANFLALRTGFLFDYIGERYELTLGGGIRYGTLNFDYSYIIAPEGFLKRFLQNFDEDKDGATGARHGQWRAAFIFTF